MVITENITSKIIKVSTKVLYVKAVRLMGIGEWKSNEGCVF